MRRPGYLAGWQVRRPRAFGDFGRIRTVGPQPTWSALYVAPDVLAARAALAPAPPAPTGSAGGFSKGAR
jgi:hypothetical protein